MIPAHRGLRGFRDAAARANSAGIWGVLRMKIVRSGSVALLAVALTLSLTGCPKKPTPGGLGDASSMGQGGLGGGSLDRFKSGMGPGEGGPLADVHFDYDRYDLAEQERSTLQQHAQWLKQNAAAEG